MARVEQLQRLKLSGLHIVQEFRRYYPQGALASTLLGRVNRGGSGQSGLELAFESHLAAEGYSLPLNRDAKGRLLNLLGWDARPVESAPFAPSAAMLRQETRAMLSYSVLIP